MKIVLAFIAFLVISGPFCLFGSDAGGDDAEAVRVGTTAELEAELFALVKMPCLSPLQQARMRELVDVVDVNVVDAKGFWPLLYAIMNKNLEAVDILLMTEGIDVNQVTPGGFTVLHNAVVKGGSVLERLLQHVDVNVNAQANDGSTPLHLGVSRGTINSIRMVLASRGGQLDLSLADDSEATAISLARRLGKEDIVVLLESFQSLSGRLNLAITPLLEEVGDCSVCLDTALPLQKLNCEHSFCNRCLLTHVSLQYNTKRYLLDKTPCLDSSCQSCLTRNDIGAIVAGNDEIFEAYKNLVIAKKFGIASRHDRLPTELAALVEAGMAARHEACGALVMKDAGCNYVNCRCGVKFCYKCGLSTTDPGHDCKAWRLAIPGV